MSTSTIRIPVNITVDSLQRSTGRVTINVTVGPLSPSSDPFDVGIGVGLRVYPIPVNLQQAVANIVNVLLKNKVESFYDVDRELKTVLNFGGDYQSLITNWKYDPDTKDRGGMVVKTYRPLPQEIEEHTQLWISRELSYSVIDRLFTIYIPNPDELLYLRPPNRSVALAQQNRVAVNGATLSTLLTTGSLDEVLPNTALEEWFTSDFNSAELNIDYTNYSNFVFYSSAQSRLAAFAQKLSNIEEIDRVIALNSGSLRGVLNTGSLSYPALQRLATEKVDLIKSFDGYERFLYYETETAYTGSHITTDREDQVFYNSDATWPKISGSVVPVASATAWYTSQMSIAEEYDRNNPNYLGNTLPYYLKNDAASSDFVKFFDLVGHQFDTLKLYIDQMPLIYDRGSDPTIGLSQDVVWNVAEAFGISLPNPYAIKNLVDYTVGESATVSSATYREAAAETWKRFLHNQIFMMKTKGTKQSLQALVNAYGVLPTVLRIRESSTPGFAYPSRSFELFEEQTNSLRFNAGAYLSIPWSSITPKTVEVRFAPTAGTSSVVLHAGNAWGMRVTPLTGSYGRVEIVSGSTVYASSSYLPLFDGEMYSAMLSHAGTGISLYVKRAEHDDITYESRTTETSTNIASAWSGSATLYLGTSGSFFGNAYTGLVDEFRVWNTVLNESIFDLHVKYPGLYNGNSLTSARDELKVRLSFSKAQNLGVNRVLLNESPYVRTSGVPANLLGFSGSAFTSVTTNPYSMEMVNREVVRYSPNAGNQFTTNKVVVVEPPTLVYTEGTSGSLIPVLYHDRSIVSLATKTGNPQPTNTIGFYFSLTDAINDSMVRSIGNFDLQNLIGDPADQYNSTYSALDEINQIYWSNYAYSFNVNSFVDFVKNLLGPLFQQAKELIPARAKLLSGIVHEPHILERSKVTVKPVIMSAGVYGQDDEMQNLEVTFETPIPDLPEVDVPTLESILNTDESRTVLVELPWYDATVDAVDDYMVVQSAYDTVESLISMPSYENEVITADTLFWDATALNLQSRYFLTANTNILNQSMSFTVDPILPFTNFENIASRTYFMNSGGLVGVDAFNRVRVGQNALVNRGNWALGTSYSRNDYILYSGSVEYVCITTDNPFISRIDPSLDTGNWKPMAYTTVATVQPRKAAVISGSISIAPVSYTGSVIMGYDASHYRFTRDTRRGVLNHQFLGCLQTDATTVDGKAVVEVLLTNGDTLYVTNPGQPVQQNNNQAGPILDVN